MRTTPLLAAGLLAGTAVLTACGGGSSTATTAGASSSAASTPAGHQHSPGMNMGGAGASPATDARSVKGATLVTGSFGLLDTRPPGTDSVAGKAFLAHGSSGTTVTLELSGLPAGKQYMAHLHADACATNNGGAHFQFEVGGPEVPPNEIHLAFTATADGKGTISVSDPKDVGTRAKAVVLHPMEAMDSRIACADFS